MFSPGRNSNVSWLMLPAVYQPLGKDVENSMNLRKDVQVPLLEEVLGTREADKKKIFKEVTPPPRVASAEDSDRDLEMSDLSWHSLTYRAGFTLPQLWQRGRNLMDIRYQR